MISLVTGATGFLGSRLARRLAERGDRVRVLARPTSDRRRIAGLDVEIRTGDITDRSSVEAALDGAEAVYHVAALYELGTPDPARMETINVGGTRNVLEAAARRAIPAVHVSSVVALGPSGPAPVGESHWRAETPRSAYEATKRAAHEIARELARGGASVRIALPVTIYGPDDPSLVGRFHAHFLRGHIPVGALADMTMSLVHVDDCAAGLVRIAEAGHNGEEYILCGDAVTFRRWIEALARVAGRAAPRVWLPDWLLRGTAPFARLAAPVAGLSSSLVREGMAMAEDVHWSFSAEKARRDLAWTSRSLEDGLRTVVAFHRR